MKEHLAITLDKVIHQKNRSGLLSILMVNKEAEFNYLKEKLNLSDGNLSTHMSHLEKAGYIKIGCLIAPECIGSAVIYIVVIITEIYIM